MGELPLVVHRDDDGDRRLPAEGEGKGRVGRDVAVNDHRLELCGGGGPADEIPDTREQPLEVTVFDVAEGKPNGVPVHRAQHAHGAKKDMEDESEKCHLNTFLKYRHLNIIRGDGISEPLAVKISAIRGDEK